VKKNKTKKGSLRSEATLVKLGIILNADGHLEFQKSFLHPDDWLAIINKSYPNYENKEIIHKFLVYTLNRTEELEADLKTFHPLFRSD
jgi:heme oxygenase